MTSSFSRPALRAAFVLWGKDAARKAGRLNVANLNLRAFQKLFFI